VRWGSVQRISYNVSVWFCFVNPQHVRMLQQTKVRSGESGITSLLEVEVADDVIVCVLCAASTEPTPHRADDLNDF
jgi:hypothetical protein